MQNVKRFKEIVDSSKDLKVLYVEDNPMILEKTKHLLETIFHTVDVAVDGEDGLRAYNEKEYDLVITDIKMPKKDGIGLIRDIKEINDEQAIIVTSAYDDSDRLVELISLGISSFIVKPMNITKFFHTIDVEVKKITMKHMMAKHIMEQFKMAQMGEMIDSIAHQWKQPVAAISVIAQAINYKIELRGELPYEEIIEANLNIQKQTQHLTETIDSFRNFFRPNQPMEIVSLGELIKLVENVMKNTLNTNLIELEILGGKDIKIKCIKTEFIHIFINLINNAKDIFKENKIENRKIMFMATSEEDDLSISTTVKVIDNGGGIPENIIEHIFDAHFTTKEKTDGTGIGLYMSKQILKKIDGNITVENTETRHGKGASFNINIINIKS